MQYTEFDIQLTKSFHKAAKILNNLTDAEKVRVLGVDPVEEGKFTTKKINTFIEYHLASNSEAKERAELIVALAKQAQSATKPGESVNEVLYRVFGMKEYMVDDLASDRRHQALVRLTNATLPLK